jgi:hypothetical protein
MKEISYLYQIIRYVPDLERMEPQNIGVIVQGSGQTISKVWKHFRPSDKRDFDYSNFRMWREFFEEEINGAQVSMFQPDRGSPEFLTYLQSRCKSNYLVTRPLSIITKTDSAEEVRDYLYKRVVSPPETDEVPALQPVRRFREQLQEKKLDKHPKLHKDEYLLLPNGDSELFKWQYERNHGSDQRVIIEPVQWLDRIRYTQMELEHVLSAAKKLREASLNALLVVVMDEVSVPSPNAKPSTEQLYENYIEGKEVLKGLSDEIVTTPEEAEVLATRIQNDLAQLHA